ncbi:hypothetical protein COY07_00710 [Candidatus Peregrinibacteria bacterium CG_4_10_14_0_2_um_filter_43_11]|nr:MAG: hypothetical protein COY07_00710 [Candidatus Peregrinibacteria bacterium CG_4_10_14_0_2_um_filter_43_11]
MPAQAPQKAPEQRPLVKERAGVRDFLGFLGIKKWTPPSADTLIAPVRKCLSIPFVPFKALGVGLKRLIWNKRATVAATLGVLGYGILR